MIAADVSIYNAQIGQFTAARGPRSAMTPGSGKTLISGAAGDLRYDAPPMNVLGIETSCDETGVALFSTESGLLADALHSQVDLHALYGASSAPVKCASGAA